MEKSRHNIIWTPWRMEYIKKVHEPGCVFCRKLKMKDGTGNLVLYRGKNAFVVLNKYPYTNGHLLIAPLKHFRDWEKLEPATLMEMMSLSQQMVKVLKKVMRPDGFNIGVNSGRSAGAGVLGHIHLHIVPRWCGDHNFLPILGAAKVMPQTLAEVYNLLKKELARHGR